MKPTIRLLVCIALAASSLLLSACMTQEARTERVERRQDRIDARTSGRQDRWEVRAEREDARAKARFDSW
jgi:hypothetical protein